MLILSTLVEKFVSVKTEKGLSSATILMTSTVVVSILAYFIVGGEIELRQGRGGKALASAPLAPGRRG